MKRASLKNRHCSLAYAGAELIDGWTLVILREILLRNCRFDGIQQQTGMSPRSLTLRLQHLVEQSILSKEQYLEKPPRFEYRLSEKGRELWPAIMMLKQWGDRWGSEWSSEAPPLRLGHGCDDHLFVAELHCADCGEVVTAADVSSEMSEAMLSERDEMKCLHSRARPK